MGIKNSLSDCLFGSNHPKHTKRLAENCHSIGLAFLRMKAASNKLYLFHGNKLEDLAWDFIADLFETGSDGRLNVFCEYFKEKEIEALDEAEIFSELRKLVFTKVEDNIFKAAGECDPSLRKIIRNLKLAVKSCDFSGEISCERGFLTIRPENHTDLAVMPSELMQIYLCSRLQEKMQIPEMLHEVIDILNNQNLYQKKFSLTGLSLIIREVFIHFNKDQLSVITEPAVDENLIKEEFEELLERSVKKIRVKVGARYVSSKKIPLSLLKAYLQAARNIVNEYNGKYQDDGTQYEYLREEIPGLGYKQFRQQHRQILEYLVKQIRTDLVNTYKKEFI